MRQKNDTEVLIGGTRYTISGYESAEYIMKIATYINDKLSVIKKNTDPRLLDNDIKNILLQINIADDYYKQAARTQAVTEEKNDADKALFELKHEMMKLTEQVEKLTARNKQLEEEKKKTVETQEQLEEERKKNTGLQGQLEEERKKNIGLQEQLEEEKKKIAEVQEQLEEEKKKTVEIQEQLEEEIKKTAETQEQLEKEKADYEELEKTIDDLLGSAE